MPAPRKFDGEECVVTRRPLWLVEAPPPMTVNPSRSHQRPSLPLSSNPFLQERVVPMQQIR